MTYLTSIGEVSDDLCSRIATADRIYGPPASAHELLGVIAEEYAELIEAIRSGKIMSVQWDAMDLAAACLRLADACENAAEPFARRSGFLDARETSQQKGLPL